MKILVTGANGYLGSGIIKQMLDDGYEVIATDRSTKRCDDRAIKIECDLFSVDDPYTFFQEPDVVLHLAWRDGFVHNSDNHIIDLPQHHKFLLKIFKSNVHRVAVMGSMHEVGFYEGSIDEDSPCKPMSLYGIAKNSLRLDVQYMASTYHKQYQWLRGYYIVGNTSYGSSVFSKLVKAVEGGKSEFPFTMGLNQFDFLDYEQFCLQTAAAVEQDAIDGIINICTGRPEKLSDRVERFISENKYAIKLNYGVFPDRPYDSKAVWGNNEKITRILEARKGKVFVTGVYGQLGYDVVNELRKRGYTAIGTDSDTMDITDAATVDSVMTAANPDAVIHCAAWTAVDMAEDDDNVELVRAVNAGGTQNIASVCKKLGCKMVYISTDYVFDGQGKEPWQPDCKDYKPLSIYGQTKLEGELAVANTLEKYFIVRSAWIFGKNGKNFVKTMLNVGKTHDTVRVVKEQIGTPTYSYDLARLLVDMIETDKYGYYHATNEGGYISWYDFTVEIYKQAGMNVNVIPVTTEEYGLSKAKRPFNSKLDKGKLAENGFDLLPTWQDALSRYLKEILE